jgi:hypothetical protein
MTQLLGWQKPGRGKRLKKEDRPTGPYIEALVNPS